MRSNVVRFAALAAVFALGACDETISTGDISEAEATELAGVIMENVIANSSTVPSAVDGPQLVPYEISNSVEFVADCPLGGTIAVMGDGTVSGDTETQDVSVEYAVSHTHAACRAMGENGNEFTLTGNPDLELEMSVDLVGETFSWDGSIEGAVDWATDGKEGTCSVNYTFEGSAAGEQSISASVSGSVCGFNVSQSFTLGAT